MFKAIVDARQELLSYTFFALIASCTFLF